MITNREMIDNIFKLAAKQIKEFEDPVVISESAKWGKDPFKVLVSTLLSLRTKDEVTRDASKRLFKYAPDLDALLKLSRKDIETIIFPVGFYRRKSENLLKVARIVRDIYNSRVPDKIEDLLKLPGVGRKTANLVTTVAYDKDGICVDTHVHRISNRLGLVRTKNADKTEIELKRKINRKHWKEINRIFVTFGKNICTPVSPKCSNCTLCNICPKLGVTKSR